MLALVGILSVVVTGVFYYNDKKKSIEKITQEKLQSVTEANKYFIETYFRERLNDAELLAHSENTYQLINELIQYKEQFNITDIDPFLTNVEEWKNIYNKYHKYFKTSQIIHSYHDILLVNKNGQVVFSCVEEKTLGEHLLTGRLKNSNLSSVWKKSKDSTTPIISDFETFVSSQNQMFAFVACPIYNEKDEYIASIILQLHVALLNEFIVKQFEKLPEFECLIIGSDYQVRLFHSQKIVEKYTLHENSNSYIDKALNSITGYTRYTDIDNIDYFACYTPLQIASMNWVLLIRVSTQIVMNPLKKIFFIVISLIFSILLSVIILYFPLNKLLIGNLKDIQHALNVLNIGEIPESIKHTNIDAEFSKISQEINTLSLGVNKLAKFANEIADNNLNTDFTPRSNADVLSKSLINIRKSLIDARQAELTRKEEDKIRNWANDGTNKLSDILQIRSESIIELTDKVVIFLVHYMNANQCGLFVYNEDDPTDECLELTSTYAYNRKKHMNKKVSVGESLIGMCALEKQTIYLDDIPENYIEVTSGLGDATPKYLLLVPLKHEENLMGIVEMASFNPFPQHEIEFLEKSGESIAASLANAKINQRTQKLLTDTKLQAEEMAAQEEEMRQNLEEMQATREEAARKERELGNIIHSIDHTFTSQLHLERSRWSVPKSIFK